uniref:Uncharacterized protein n=1 Tax=Oryza glumipatula TaxID=40148 RepID=A0A0E0ADN2_9ORYZ
MACSDDSSRISISDGGITPDRRFPERSTFGMAPSQLGIGPNHPNFSDVVADPVGVWQRLAVEVVREEQRGELFRFQNKPLMLTKELIVNEKNSSCFRLPISGETCPPMTLRLTRSAFIAVQV